jgi:cytochrome P450
MIPALTPPRPRTPWFDESAGAWILSRYNDVLAAFRDTRLWTIAVSGKDQMEVRDESGRLAARSEMQESLAHAKVAEWRPHLEVTAGRVLAGLPGNRRVDLLRDFSQPCCLFLAVLITGADPADALALGELGAAAFGGAGAPAGSTAQESAVAATAELKGYFEKRVFRAGEPTFVGTSQTMARLLATGWLALLSHPAEYQRLHAHPEFMATAVEELLRYAGIVPTLYRRAYAAVEVGGAPIAEGQNVHLKIASANRDAEQFPDPDSLDVTRRSASHLSLGIGRNSCVGNLVIRMASAVMTGALVRKFPQARVEGEAEWQSSPSFCWPNTVPVILGPEPD